MKFIGKLTSMGNRKMIIIPKKHHDQAASLKDKDLIVSVTTIQELEESATQTREQL
jgi:hypothetical protein